jgi:hypothetical protein
LFSALQDLAYLAPDLRVLQAPRLIADPWQFAAAVRASTGDDDLVRKLYGHRDRERALDRVTTAYERTASFTQMRLV